MADRSRYHFDTDPPRWYIDDTRRLVFIDVLEQRVNNMLHIHAFPLGFKRHRFRVTQIEFVIARLQRFVAHFCSELPAF